MCQRVFIYPHCPFYRHIVSYFGRLSQAQFWGLVRAWDDARCTDSTGQDARYWVKSNSLIVTYHREYLGKPYGKH